ncbi:OmpA family protein [Melioribacter sp. OK-6-Me]|uniref:OmpA family protein n=1 Tax=unclassified Melioribacter TaxID=2627329 RepID=UPI003ED9BF9F
MAEASNKRPTLKKQEEPPQSISYDEQPPIIKKIKKVDGGHHGGAWKVAYADFVTAMMALFIVLWVLGQSEEVKEAVAGYFSDPIGFSTKGKSILEGNSNSLIDSKILSEIERKELERQELEKMGEKLKEELAKETELENLSDQVKIEVVKEGLRIELIDSANDIFFEVGTAELKPEARRILSKIGTEISKMNNKIIIEGHTDARQYRNDGTGYTNFELSTDRANAAKRVLVAAGVSEKQIDEISGYADTRLRDQNDPYSSINRRISITLKYSND